MSDVLNKQINKYDEALKVNIVLVVISSGEINPIHPNTFDSAVDCSTVVMTTSTPPKVTPGEREIFMFAGPFILHSITHWFFFTFYFVLM